MNELQAKISYTVDIVGSHLTPQSIEQEQEQEQEHRRQSTRQTSQSLLTEPVMRYQDQLHFN